jgi:tetratricopeptide (TPR) repeat protein
MGMRLLLLLALLATAALSVSAQELKTRPKTNPQQPAVMVDEDEDLLPQTSYAFNPVQAKKELKIGAFYQKKGNERAAAARYLEATRWNPSFSDAYWRLAEVRDELEQHNEALDAYRRFAQLEPEDGRAEKARKRIEEIEAELLKAAASEHKDAAKTEQPQ